MAGQSLVTEIEGCQLTLTNLDKVLYPDGMTKGQVIDYYVRIAPVMLPHLAGRNITMKRYPNGTDGQSFYNKNIPSHAPDWIERVELHDNTYIVCRDLPTLVWMANLAALELHVPLHRTADSSADPDRIVFDLDPGPGTGIAECCDVALIIAAVLEPLGMTLHAKTSGSKGMQLYATPPTPLPYGSEGGVTELAKRLAEGLALSHPDRLEPERQREDDGVRIFASGETGADCVDADHVGRSAGRSRRATAALHRASGVGTRRRVRRSLRSTAWVRSAR